MLNVIFLIGGIITIILSANWLVDGASSIAKKLGISDMVIGLTIVAFGTSAPELTVNVFSALRGSTDIAIGNVLGSNIGNIFLILGLSAMIFPIAIQNNTKWKEIPFSLLAVIILGIMANDQFIDSSQGNIISRADGLVLLCFMIIFLVYTFELARHSNKQELLPSDINPSAPAKSVSVTMAVFLIAAGLTGLYFGGKYLVTGAVNIAKLLGMSEKVIGLTIISIGTSLPELATSVVAAYKKKPDLAVGNIVGSNIFNVFFILGITSLVKPIAFNPLINFDILVAILASVCLFLSTITFDAKKIGRIEGFIFLVVYVGYIAFTVAN